MAAKAENQFIVKSNFVYYLYVYMTEAGMTKEQIASYFGIEVKDVNYHFKNNKDKLEKRGIFYNSRKKFFYRKSWKFKDRNTGEFI
jgi:predicted XRE-type DNA-binding protein